MKKKILCRLGICGGSASGKTTVAQKIIESLDVPWVTLLSMDCFYKVNFYTPFLLGLQIKVRFFTCKNFIFHS